MALDVVSPGAGDVSVAFILRDISMDCEEVFENLDGLRDVVP